MVNKSRLLEQEFKKRLDTSKVEIGADIGPIDRITSLEDSTIPRKENNDTDQRSNK